MDDHDKPSPPPLLNVRQAAEYLGVSEVTILRLRRSGKVKFFRIGKCVRFHLDHLNEYLASVEAPLQKHQKRFLKVV